MAFYHTVRCKSVTKTPMMEKISEFFYSGLPDFIQAHAVPPVCPLHRETLLGNPFERNPVIFEDLLQRVGDRSNVVAGQAGDAELPVMLNDIQVQGISHGGLAQEPHVRDPFRIGRFAQGTDIIRIERIVTYPRKPGKKTDCSYHSYSSFTLPYSFRIESDSGERNGTARSFSKVRRLFPDQEETPAFFA